MKKVNNTEEDNLCPVCKSSKKVIKFVYGEPTIETFKKIEQGKFIQGGCIVYDKSPKWYCKKCDIEFGIVNLY